MPNLTFADDLFDGSNVIDNVNGLAGDDFIRGLGGNDKLVGGDGDDELNGGSGDDSLVGGNGDDRIFGGSGNDTIVGGPGADYINGGSGIDTVTYAAASEGIDVFVGNYTQGLGGDGEGDVLVGVEIVIGSKFADYMEAGSVAVTFKGGDGEDTLVGGRRADTLDGGHGADTMAGGRGGDNYSVDNKDDLIDDTIDDGEDAGGIDTISSAITLSLAPSEHILGTIENLTLTGGKAINGTGNDVDNTIIGNASRNIIEGGLGSDDLTGGGGNDRFVYRAIEESTPAAKGRDTVLDFAPGDKLDLDKIDTDAVRSGDQDFAFIGTAEFFGFKGALRYESDGTNTFVQADIDGDKKADFTVKLVGDMSLSIDDFVGVTEGLQFFDEKGYIAVVNDTPLTWLQAATQAEAMGGHLATIASAAENNFVFSLVDEKRYWSPNGNHGSWLGGYQAFGSDEPEGGWRWVTDEAFSFDGWNRDHGEPGNSAAEGGGEMTLHYHFPKDGVPLWNDLKNEPDPAQPELQISSYIVEFDSLESHVPTTLELLGPG